MRGGVLAREGEGVLGDVGRRDDRVGPRHGDRDRDRAAARADVEHARLGRLADALQRPLDEPLGLGPGHQHAVVDGELEPAEAPAPEHVCERLAAPPPAQQLAEARDLVGHERALEIEVQVEAPEPEGVGEQPVGVESRGAHAPVREPVGRLADELAHRRERHPFSAS